MRSTWIAIDRLLVSVACLLALSAGCQRNGNPGTPPSAKPHIKAELQPFFREVTAETGIDCTYRNGEEADHFSILESLGGGVALFDFDGDGLLDVFVVGGGYFGGPDKKTICGHANRLYKNLGAWKFRDVTAAAGLDRPLFYGHGVAVADYDRDGWPDLLVTGYGRVCLYHNEADGKDGRHFVDVTQEMGLTIERAMGMAGQGVVWTTSAAWADLDGDGFPDLYVCQYVDWSFANHPRCKGNNPKFDFDVCPPQHFQALPHVLWHNQQGKRFVNVARAAGLRQENPPSSPAPHPRNGAGAPQGPTMDCGKGLGVVAVDVNGDGKPDLYVANDTSDNFLYLNESKPGVIRLRDVGMEAGVARDAVGAANGSMGVDAADYNSSGRASLWVTNFENDLHGLYRNFGIKGNGPLFVHSTHAAGIAAIGQNYVGFGTGFIDVDNDGWEDLFISNGHVLRFPVRENLKQIPILFKNTSGHFQDATASGGAYFASGHRGRGVAFGDLDNDGWPDIVVSHVNERVAVLRNTAGSGNHWLGAALAMPDRRDVVGAKVVTSVAGRKLTRFAKGGGSYLSANDPRIVFGMAGAEQMGELIVTWPTGAPRMERWCDLATDRYHRIEQGKGEAVNE